MNYIFYTDTGVTHTGYYQYLKAQIDDKGKLTSTSWASSWSSFCEATNPSIDPAYKGSETVEEYVEWIHKEYPESKMLYIGTYPSVDAFKEKHPEYFI